MTTVMSGNPKLPRLSLVYLYPRRMNLYADRGNVLALARRYTWRGGILDVIPVEVGESMPVKWDMLFMGGGEDRSQTVVAPDLLKRRDALHEAMSGGSVMLGICGGYQLFGANYQAGKDMLPGVGLLDVETHSSATREQRMIGNIAANMIDEVGGWSTTLIGFENHGGQTRITDTATRPLARTVVGFGNNRIDREEGARKANVFGSYMHGSLLPKNPAFADYLLTLAARRHDADLMLCGLDDTIELDARRSILVDILGLDGSLAI